MPFSKNNHPTDISALISQLDEDRAWILQKIDQGNWQELRLDLAALERELGQLLMRAKEKLEDIKSN